MSDRAPLRGEIWQVAFDPVVGHEQGGDRPAVVISSDYLNEGPWRLAVVVPISRRDRGNPLHVRIDPDRNGLPHTSFVLCDVIRSISHERLRFRRGRIDEAALFEIERGVLRLPELD